MLPERGSARNLLLVGNWESDAGYAWRMIERFWIALAHAYRDRRVILCFPQVRSVNPEVIAAGIEVCEFTFDLTKARDLVRFIRQHRIGHLYLTDKPYMTGFYPLLRLFGVRSIIVHAHAPGARDLPRGPKRVIKSVAARIFGADAYIACSRFVLERFKDCGRIPPKRCYLARNGIVPNPLQRAEQTIRRELGLGQNTILIVSSARADQYKRIDNIIDAALIVRAARPNTPVCFIHCGGGPDFELLAARVREQSLEGYFRLLGKRSDMDRVLVGCDIAVHASQGEVGLCLAILEFMSAGLPSVVADDPSVWRECIRDGETGLLFRSGSPEDLSDQLLRLIDDQCLRQRIGSMARRTVNAEYDLRDTVSAVVGAVKAVLD
jgi:glycosyltransferase involved in cell wall biosynthesis